jgi:hypothetical protein
VVDAGEEFEISRTNSISDKFWSSPGFTEKAIVLRGVSKLYRIENTN